MRAIFLIGILAACSLAQADPEPGAGPKDCCCASSADSARVYAYASKEYEARYPEMRAYVARLTTLADAGNAEAQYYLGMHYHNGFFVAPDPHRAYDLFRQAAAAGDPLAAFKVGCYLDGEFAVVPIDHDKAFESKLIAARAGYDEAQIEVAVHFHHMEKAEESLKWFKAAADQGNPEALYLLAGLYDIGRFFDPVMAYATMSLAKNAMGDDFSQRKQATLDKMAGALNAADRAKAERLVAQWRAQPTPLSEKAHYGLAAEESFLKSVTLAAADFP